MHTGIRSSGAVQRSGFLKDGTDGFLKDVLDGAAILLGLPAGISRSVIINQQSVVSHKEDFIEGGGDVPVKTAPGRLSAGNGASPLAECPL